jgi:hypothetical protein
LGIDATALKSVKSGGRLTFELRDFPQFDRVKALVSQNCFVGMEDIIPGLANEVLPNPRAGGNLAKAIDL